MSRNARCILPGLPYHVTQRGTDRQNVFFTAGDRQTYLSLLADNLADTGVRVLAFCLMTNHVHLVVVPDHADSLAVLFRRVHGAYAQALNTRRRRTGHLWQSRFYSCPMAEWGFRRRRTLIPEGTRTAFRAEGERFSERSDAGRSIVEQVFGFVKKNLTGVSSDFLVVSGEQQFHLEEGGCCGGGNCAMDT